MPDWFYRTISRPILFRLPARTARSLALGFMGQLVRLPLGGQLIDFLGHMRADERLHQTCFGLDFATPIGLGAALDRKALALPALARFGVGFLEIGPVTMDAATPGALGLRPDQQVIESAAPAETLGLSEALPRLTEVARLGLPRMIRVGADAPEVLRRTAGLFQFAALDGLCEAESGGSSSDEWANQVRAAAEAAGQPLVIVVPANRAEGDRYVAAALEAGAVGVLVEGVVASGSGTELRGLPTRVFVLETVHRLRASLDRKVGILASGGVHEPEDALVLLDAGADLVLVDTGLIFSGPGLPKRINDALLFHRTRGQTAPAERPGEMTWFWTALLGFGMLMGGLMALVIAATSVVLPYDEAIVGLSRAELGRLNPRLLAFMAHDRVSLAGVMLAVGAMYLGLSLGGIRGGLHWARLTVFVSAFTGFVGFFLFLGFGYLDVFHAFVTAALLQLLLLAVHAKPGVYLPTTAPWPRENAIWRRALWGQLLLIGHGAGLLAAGVTIAVVGVTHVFVHEDLEFMGTTAEALQAAHPRLVPLIAHDRATLGSMLLAAGWAFLLPALWGFRNGSSWLWTTTLLAGLLAYAAALGVHFAVGYTDPMHLLPAFAGLGVLLTGLGLSRGYLCDS